ncbi:MAG: ABC transporter permease, partial [Firmicutes bacterium]|nr:ABC transporter permease [Bacillota bacterium]
RLPENKYELVVDKLIVDRLKENYSDISMAGYNTPEEILGRHLVLKNLPEFTIVGFTDKDSPCIYADPSMFINMLANKGSEYDYYYDGQFQEGYAEEPVEVIEPEENNDNYSETVGPSSTSLVDVELKKDEIKLTENSSWPDNDYEVIIDNSYSKSIKLGNLLKTKVNGQKLKVVGYYTSDTVRNEFLVNNNMIKYQLILGSENMTIKPAEDKAETIAQLEAYGAKVQDLYEQQKKEYRKSQMDIMRAFLLVGGIIIIISLIEIFLIMRASFLSRIKEVGTLRAIGVKKWDIYRMFAGEIIAITICASVPGWLMMNYLVSKLQGISYLENMFVCSLETVIGSLILIFAFNLLFGLMPVFRTLIKRPAAILARTDVN